MGSETEVMDSENEVVDHKFLPTDQKWYSLRNPPNVNHSDIRSTRRSMEWNNLIVGSNELYSVSKSYSTIVNDIDNFVKPTPPTNIITNETIIIQYIIKQVLKVFGKKDEAAVRKELQQFHYCRVVKPKKPQDLSYE